MKIHRSQFLKALKERYPEIRDEINSRGGLFTLEVSVFLDLVQKYIDEGKRESFREAIALVNHFYLHGNKALKNLILNGLCEDLIFENSKKNARSWALELIPLPLAEERNAWRKFIGLPNNALEPSDLKGAYQLTPVHTTIK